MKIITYPNESLRKRCTSVFPGDIESDVIASMIDTMYSGGAVGLAAPQVGIDKTLFVMDPTAGEKAGLLEVVINPEIHNSEGEVAMIEGCLSFPGVTERVSRASTLDVSYTNGAGTLVKKRLTGFPAVVFQHEFDHLNGRLFIDHISSLKKKLLLKDYTRKSVVNT